MHKPLLDTVDKKSGVTIVKLMIGLWCHTQQMFWMTLSFVTKTFQNILVLKISNEGFLANQHSVSITKHKFAIQLLVLLSSHLERLSDLLCVWFFLYNYIKSEWFLFYPSFIFLAIVKSFKKNLEPVASGVNMFSKKQVYFATLHICIH